MKNAGRFFGLVLAAIVGLQTATLARPGWRVPEMTLQSRGEPVGTLLRAFAVEQGVPISLPTDVSIPVAGDFRGMAATDWLDAVCGATDLIWFWDGNRLYIDRANDRGTRVIGGEGGSPEAVRGTFEALGFASGPGDRGAMVRGGDGVLTLSGGPRFLELGETVLRTLADREKERFERLRAEEENRAALQRQQRNALEVRVFRLKHASASDIQVRSGTAQTTVPGVARALQNIMGTPLGALSTGGVSTERRRQMTGLRGTGLAAIGGAPAAPSSGASVTSPNEPEQEDDEQRPIIQADPRLNAVIVRDTVERLPQYEALIRELDLASPVIEISAAVVDLDAENGRSLGVEFLSFGNGNSRTRVRAGFEADRGFNNNDGTVANPAPTFQDGTDLVRGSGALSSVLVPVSGYELLARIRALEEKGDAQLVTSPSVITLENVEANLRQEEAVFVRVAGQEATDLFDVRAGVQLRVTPTLVREGEEISFRLIVEVQDGSFSDLRVDGVPSTRESAITTQAIVPGNRTLLIGGYFVERRVNNTRQVPVLGNVPVLGRLFKRTENNQARAQRYFFITPRFVDIHRESRLNPAQPDPGKTPLPTTHADSRESEKKAYELAARTRVPLADASKPSE